MEFIKLAAYAKINLGHDSRLFIIEMEAHYSFRIYERMRTDGRNVCLEILYRNRRRKRFFLDYTGAYSYVMEKAVEVYNKMEFIKLAAYAKINLGLDVVRRLENGYHEVKVFRQCPPPTRSPP